MPYKDPGKRREFAKKYYSSPEQKAKKKKRIRQEEIFIHQGQVQGVPKRTHIPT